MEALPLIIIVTAAVSIALTSIIMLVVVFKIGKHILRFSSMFYRTMNVVSGIKQAEAEYHETPRSVGAATQLHLSNILRDNPSFPYEEMKAKAENQIFEYLRAYTQMDPGMIGDGNFELKNQLRNQISQLLRSNITVHIDEIKIHKTGIKSYKMLEKQPVITFETALQYIYYQEKNGRLHRGEPGKIRQARYAIDYVHTKEHTYHITDEKDGRELTNCPNCGAPLEMTAKGECAFCGTPFAQVGKKDWKFVNIRET